MAKLKQVKVKSTKEALQNALDLFHDGKAWIKGNMSVYKSKLEKELLKDYVKSMPASDRAALQRYGIDPTVAAERNIELGIANSFCSLGAIAKVNGPYQVKATAALAKAIYESYPKLKASGGGTSLTNLIVYFNDRKSTKYVDVKKVFKKAIASV